MVDKKPSEINGLFRWHWKLLAPFWKSRVCGNLYATTDTLHYGKTCGMQHSVGLQLIVMDHESTQEEKEFGNLSGPVKNDQVSFTHNFIKRPINRLEEEISRVPSQQFLAFWLSLWKKMQPENARLLEFPSYCVSLLSAVRFHSADLFGPKRTGASSGCEIVKRVSKKFTPACWGLLRGVHVKTMCNNT